jgi:hypothetical protein
MGERKEDNDLAIVTSLAAPEVGRSFDLGRQRPDDDLLPMFNGAQGISTSELVGEGWNTQASCALAPVSLIPYLCRPDLESLNIVAAPKDCPSTCRLHAF